MANLLWGQVYYHGIYAGILRQEPGERFSFTYDASYVERGRGAIAWTLPLQAQAHVSQVGLHPFFDNLVAEGWLEEAQRRLIDRRRASRFELLLAFGQDCAGAVSIEDPTPAALDRTKIDKTDSRQVALQRTRASLSGIQPKFTLIKEKGKYRSARAGELSTHIGKLPSDRHGDLVSNEYLTMRAFQTLLPNDDVVEFEVGSIEGVPDPCLIIKRFDRSQDGARIHFEEFNQLLGRTSEQKYDGNYKEMAGFIRETPGCLPAEAYRLYLRILAGLLLGNTDMHFKNFAMFHAAEGFRLTPSYDQVSAALYNYKTVALGIGNNRELQWTELKSKSLIRLGEDFGLSGASMRMAIDALAKRKDAASDAVNEAEFGTKKLKDAIIKRVRTRWNGTFSLIGRALSRKR